MQRLLYLYLSINSIHFPCFTTLFFFFFLSTRYEFSIISFAVELDDIKMSIMNSNSEDVCVVGILSFFHLHFFFFFVISSTVFCCLTFFSEEKQTVKE